MKRKMMRKPVVIVLLTLTVISATGCSQWYCDRAEYTTAKDGSSATAPQYNAVTAYEPVDTSDIKKEISSKAQGVEENAAQAKEDYSESVDNVTKSMGEVQDSIQEGYEQAFTE